VWVFDQLLVEIHGAVGFEYFDVHMNSPDRVLFPGKNVPGGFGFSGSFESQFSLHKFAHVLHKSGGGNGFTVPNVLALQP
jgi:hypothetical protein